MIQDEDFSRTINSNSTNRVFSAKSNREKTKHLTINKKLSDKFGFVNTENDAKSTNNKYLKIPRIQNRRGNITLDDSSNYSNKNESQTKKRHNSKFKKKKSNNIINIVNNVNGHNDKNNNIGLKVNINRYDIKYYIPPKKNNGDKNKNSEKNLISSNDSSKTSQEIIIDNDFVNSDYRSNNGDKKNGINVDIINFSRRNTKKISDKNNQKQKNKEDIDIEKRLRRQILHKIKSMNNLCKTDFMYNRPKLELDSQDSYDSDNKPKVCFRKFMSKEINFNNDRTDSKDRFDKIDFNNYFNENDSRSNIDNKNRNIGNKNYVNSRNSNSISTKKISNTNNTSVEKFELNFINNTKNNNLNTDYSDIFKSNKNNKFYSDYNLISVNNQDNETNDNNLNKLNKNQVVGSPKKGTNKFKNDNDNEIENIAKLRKNKRKKKIRKKGSGENGQEISYSIEVTDSKFNSNEDLGKMKK